MGLCPSIKWPGKATISQLSGGVRAMGVTMPIPSNKIARQRDNQSIIRRNEGCGRDGVYPVK